MSKKIIGLMLMFALLGFAVCADECEHVWGPFTVTREPTCSLPGLEERVCTLCGASDAETLETSDHTYGAWEVYGDSSHVRYCTACGAADKEEHDRSISKDITAASSAKLGKRDYTCAKCGYSFRRLVSIYENLYDVDGDDLLKNGTAYLKVNTISLAAGGERALTLYTDASVDFYASANSKLLIYANVNTGAYKALSLSSGTASVTVTGDADLEFISVEDGASLTLQFTGGKGSLHLSSLPGSGLRISLNDQKLCVLRYDGVRGECFVYPCPDGRIVLSGKGGKTSAEPVNKAAPASFKWEYDVSTSYLSTESEGGTVRVLSADNSTLLYGSSSGTLDESLTESGWYMVFSAGGVSPVYSYAGEILGTADAGDVPTDAEDSEEPDLPSVEVPAITVSVLTADSEYSETFTGSPKITVNFSGGTYRVRVSDIPDKWTFDHIGLEQTFSYGGFRLVNRYTAEAEFTIDDYPGELHATVYFLDRSGDTQTVSAGSFEYQ